ncbi:Flagellar motor switch protein FliM [Paraconexibacter sp. AEG42_29]|uniref:Flagellar motor switch protein FliM n=1 Tax=Paraconexibacter sp. AEG42_29 TaxID=2997339 RepID=A0AAU7ANM3_9ACTN
MNDFLNPDEIEALFARASEGNLPMEAPPAGAKGGRRTRWLRTVDFTRPTKFSTDQERRLRRLLDGFCGVSAQRVHGEHRLPLELEVIDVQQLTWANAFKLLPESSVFCTLDTAPHEGRMLLSAELPLMVTAVEGLLGGDTSGAVKDRPLTDIDLILVRRLARTLVETLSGIWFDLAEITLSLADVGTLAERVQVAAGSEPTLMLTMEARLHKGSGTMALLVPYAAIAPAAAAFSQREEDAGHHDPEAVRAVRAGLERVDVTVRAEVADTHLTLEQILSLAPGDLIRLDAPSDSPVTLYADRTPVHEARAGRWGTRRAVQITGPVEVVE